MAYLEVNDINKSFGTNKVLKGISFTLEKGDVLAIIGSSGSGKTTLLRCITFLERADKGILSVNGNILYDMSKVVVPDGTISSELSSPLTSPFSLISLKQKYRKYMSSQLIEIEQSAKVEIPSPKRGDSIENLINYLTNPYMPPKYLKIAKELYCMARRAQMDKESKENNISDKAKQLNADIENELKQFKQARDKQYNEDFTSENAQDYLNILKIKGCPKMIHLRATEKYLQYFDGEKAVTLSADEIRKNLKSFSAIRREGKKILKTIGNAGYVRSKRLHFGLVFQGFNLFPQYTVLKNIMIAPTLMIKEELKMLAYYNKAAKLQKDIDAGKAKKSLEKKIAKYTAKGDVIANTLASEDVLAAKETIRRVSTGEDSGKLRRVYIRRRRAEIEKNAYALLEQVGLSDKAKAYPCELSGGQCQRVAIARALAMRPNILCFDEPTSALDPELTGEVLKVIKGLKSSDRTMIVVTHEMDFAKAVADKVIFMAGGVIEECGTPSEVFDNPQSAATKAFLNKNKEI